MMMMFKTTYKYLCCVVDERFIMYGWIEVEVVYRECREKKKKKKKSNLTIIAMNGICEGGNKVE
jgi:hypothetical protein